ncbi:Ppx/GppA family phosphatase [Pikeienuella piscinae]|uniref:Ppx/GppA family phosphatase n=1 Tax=Pikeienuella piscinae TaxID=2748098 RepID=A0A7L5BW67_9RHOB|nr:Ppx/GppA phosphatase family protein [Pikeienuella piscinae]QIE54124.1 Ppx/GppA family phosphatase [Pikeienuella piscinae]
MDGETVPRTTRAGAVADGGAASVAGLDLGTNNCRLLVARPEGATLRVIDSFSRAIRLGDGMEKSGALDPAAMDRAVGALKICADKIARAGPQSFRAVATAACRQALNGDEFALRVREETGIHLEIITAEEESRLAVAGCGPLVDPEAERVLIFDIGGGSTELVLLDLAEVDPAERADGVRGICASTGDAGGAEGGARILDWVSIPVGVATLEDKFAEIADPGRRFGLMTWYFEELIAGFARPMAEEAGERPLQLIGASGSVTTIGAAHLGLRRYDRSRVDGLWLPFRSARRIARELASLSDDARAHHPSIGADRARLIVASCAILSAILNAWPTQRLRVADRGLREGLIYTLNAGARA